jgi:hypothetical protein
MFIKTFRGIGEPKYMPVIEWASLNKILTDALSSYNELNAAMDLVRSRTSGPSHTLQITAYKKEEEKSVIHPFALR